MARLAALGLVDTPEMVSASSTLESTDLVGDQVVALEHKADGVVAVGVPVPVLVLLGGDAVDDQVAGIVAVQAADDVEEGGFAGAAGAQDGDELIVPRGSG